MWFKKTKLKNPTTTDITQAYFATKKRNSFVSMIAILIVTVFIGFIWFFLISRFSGLGISFQLPQFVTTNIPFLSTKPVDEKLNILLTGIGGAGHDGSDLTDTIIFASINKRTKSVAMISIPRDLYVDFTIGKQKGRGKINELYQRALFKKLPPEDSMQVLVDKVEEITGERVNRFLNIDFAGFTDFVDTLGGIDVEVPENIVDREYPDNNWGYQTFRLNKGFQTLSGPTALKFVRSRHSSSDFDRSARQQLVIAAIKDKLISLDALTSPTKLKWLYDSIASHLRTNLSFAELLDLGVFGAGLDRSSIISYNIHDGCYQGAAYCTAWGFLYTPERALFGGSAVLLPDTASAANVSEYTNIKRFVGMVSNSPEIYLEKSEITLVNATRETGLAAKLATKLRKFGFTIADRESTVTTKDPIVASRIDYIDIAQDPSRGILPSDQTLTSLQSFFSAPPTATGALNYTKLVGPKIEIILGPDAKSLFDR
jgi:LCP family protein required for cell wall assembly